MGTTQIILLKVYIATIFHKKQKILKKYRKIEAKTVKKIEKYGIN